MSERSKLQKSINDAALSSAEIGDILVDAMTKICLETTNPMAAANAAFQAMKSKIVAGQGA